MRKMNIGTQIILGTFLVVIITIAGLATASVYYFSRYAHEEAQRGALLGVSGMKNFIEGEMQRARTFRDQLSRNQEIIGYVASQNAQSLNRVLSQLMHEAGVEIVVVLTGDGSVMSRPYDTSRVGVSGEEYVRMSMGEQTWGRILVTASTAFGYYSGTPLRTADGEIVGTIIVAMPLDSEAIVDRIKELFDTEVTIFAGATRVSTTIVEGGRRVVGTDAPEAVQQAVLRGGQDLSMPIKLFGLDYFAAYTPIRDPATGEIVGMFFSGRLATESVRAIRSTIISMAVISVIVFIIAFLISIFTARRISKPLEQIVAIAKKCGTGDLTIKKEDFNYNGGGELGDLVDALSEMVSAQLEAMSQVIHTSDEVTNLASSLSSLSDENASAMANSVSLIKKISALCDTNVQAVERSSASISEMAVGSDSVAQMAVDSASSLAKTTQMSKLAVNSVNSLVDDIKTIDKKTDESLVKVRMLSNSVTEISNFMGVIASIADQTNLLALNAAIEAARAGEAGRGFAVVAEEVRKLAEDSRNASKSVEKLVALLSQNAGEAISASDQSASVVTEIMSKASATADGLNSALTEITHANEAIQSIAAVAQEQAAGSAEISRAVKEIERGTEDIAKALIELKELSEQASDIGKSVADSAHEVAQNAVDLKDATQHFHV